MPEFRHRTDMVEMIKVQDIIINQVNLISGRSGIFLTKTERNDLYEILIENISNIFAVLIALSESLHDYKDKDIEKTLEEIKIKDNQPINIEKNYFKPKTNKSNNQ